MPIETNNRTAFFDSVSATGNIVVLNRRQFNFNAEYVETDDEIIINFPATGTNPSFQVGTYLSATFTDKTQVMIKYLPLGFTSEFRSVVKLDNQITIAFDTTLKYNMLHDFRDFLFTGLQGHEDYLMLYGHGADTLTEIDYMDILFHSYYALLRRYYFKVLNLFFHSKINYSYRTVLYVNTQDIATVPLYLSTTQPYTVYNNISSTSYNVFAIYSLSNLYLSFGLFEDNLVFDFKHIVFDAVIKENNSTQLEFYFNSSNYTTVINKRNLIYNLHNIPPTSGREVIIKGYHLVFKSKEFANITGLYFHSSRLPIIGANGDVLIFMGDNLHSKRLTERTLILINEYLDYKDIFFNCAEPDIQQIETPEGIVYIEVPKKYYDIWVLKYAVIPVVLKARIANVQNVYFSSVHFGGSYRSVIFGSVGFAQNIRDLYISRTRVETDFNELFIARDFISYLLFNAIPNAEIDTRYLFVVVEGGKQYITRRFNLFYMANRSSSSIELYEQGYQYQLVDYTNIQDTDLITVVAKPIFTPFYHKYEFDMIQRDRLFIADESNGKGYDNLTELIVDIEISSAGYTVNDYKLAVNSPILISSIKGLHEDTNKEKYLNDVIHKTRDIRIELKSYRMPRFKNILDMEYTDWNEYEVYALKVYCPTSVFSYLDTDEIYIHIEYSFPEVDKLKIYNLILRLKYKT